MTSRPAGAVSREPLAATDGRSGSLLERVVLAGGQVLVVKRGRPGGDWIMRASHGRGRAAELWTSGVLARREAGGADEVPGLIGRGWERFAETVPAGVAEPGPGGWSPW